MIHVFQLCVVDNDGYETYGEIRNIGIFSSLKQAIENVPTESEMKHPHPDIDEKLPFFQGTLTILKHELNVIQNSVTTVWEEFV